MVSTRSVLHFLLDEPAEPTKTRIPMIVSVPQTPRDLARKYLRRRWCVVPVPYASKAPSLPRWQRLRITESNLGHYFDGGALNIGVLLGAPSRWLIDVDLDHEVAVHVASQYLPATRSVFGRPSKLRSHWLYYASRPVATRQWRLPDKQMVVELRSTGGQTVFPGSIHPSGEPIEWDLNGEPQPVDPDLLLDRLQQIFDEVCRRLNVSRHRPVAGRGTGGLSAPVHVVERARRYLAELPPAVSGQGGHNATFHAACVLVIGFGLDGQQALALLRHWNETCQPPWTERELAHKVDDAMKQPGWRGYLLERCITSGTLSLGVASAIERANRHAIAHRRRAKQRLT